MRNKLGYTIIELVVVMGIISIVMTLMFPSFSSYNRRRSLQQGTMMLKQAIDQAKVSAASPAQDLDTTTNVGYQVSFGTVNALPEEITICPSPAMILDLEECRNEQTVTMPAGVNVKEVKWWDGNTSEENLTSEPSEMTLKFALNNGQRTIYGDGLDITAESVSKNYLIFRLQNIKNGNTKDLIMNLLTGYMYVKD